MYNDDNGSDLSLNTIVCLCIGGVVVAILSLVGINYLLHWLCPVLWVSMLGFLFGLMKLVGIIIGVIAVFAIGFIVYDRVTCKRSASDTSSPSH